MPNIIFKYSFIACLFFLAVLGCNIPAEKTGTELSTSDNTKNQTTSTTLSDLPSMSLFSPLSVSLSMGKAPRLNEEATVTCIVKSIGHDAPNTTANINLPEGAVLVRGNIDWQGDLLADVPVQFSVVIKFIKERKWTIEAAANHEVDESHGWRAHDYINIDVGADAGSFFEINATTSDLIELDPTYQPQLPPVRPITMKVDSPLELPRLDESIQWNWYLQSAYDIPKVVCEIGFYRPTVDSKMVSAPLEDVLIDGNLNWEGPLIKDIPVHLSVTFKLPQEGYWEIRHTATGCINDEPVFDYQGILLTVSKDKTVWGWTDYTQSPPPPAEPPSCRETR